VKVKPHRGSDDQPVMRCQSQRSPDVPFCLMELPQGRVDAGEIQVRQWIQVELSKFGAQPPDLSLDDVDIDVVLYFLRSGRMPAVELVQLQDVPGIDEGHCRGFGRVHEEKFRRIFSVLGLAEELCDAGQVGCPSDVGLLVKFFGKVTE